jgi:hypothetical protein
LTTLTVFWPPQYQAQKITSFIGVFPFPSEVRRVDHLALLEAILLRAFKGHGD